MSEKRPAILIVDDDPVALELIRVSLNGLGFDNLITTSDGGAVLGIVRDRPVSAVLLDLFMPDVSGFEVLASMTRDFPRIPVIVVTAADSVDAAVRCMKQGAFDFMTKPIDRNRLGSAVTHALRVRDLEDRLRLFGTEHAEIDGPVVPEIFERILTVSPRMRAVFQYIEAIAPSPNAVLVTGESGTGKELIARSIHRASGRAGQFVVVNVAGLDDAMFTDTLFGHLKGAFTGADRARGGLVERAEGGTLFLDEIGDLEPGSQIKLLRLLQEGEYYPLGSDEPSTAHVRIVAATNADLIERQRTGQFRKDLYYRLISHLVHVPPLRERREDVALLTKYFVAQTARAMGRGAPVVTQDAEEILQAYSFPGNVRELQAMVADAVSSSRNGELSVQVLRQYIRMHSEGRVDEGETRTEDGRFSWNGPFPRLADVEEALFAEAMRRSADNQSAAARLLGISQSTLSRRFAKKR